MAAPSCHIVDGDGEFSEDSGQEFFSSVKMDHVGRDYQVVAIMGPQSSGKSTLLNTVFGTSFQEMNALSGRQQTTRGIWLARSPKIDEPTTLVMDLEGNDGRERGEDDTSFERQTALFALAVADVVLINMWAKDIGRETGAGKPLLKTIFQVNLRLFTPAPNKRKTVLLFVFRDRTKTPLEKLTEVWEADLQRMWASITKPPQYEALSFTDFFEVKYAALSNYEEREEDFRAEAVMLRRRFTSDEADDTLVRVSNDKVPGNSLFLSMAKVWEVVKANKDLNLPAHRVMVANIRCEEIVHDQLKQLQGDELWGALKQEAAAGLVVDFGERAGGFISSCLSGYDEEARYFESGVCAAKRSELVAAVRTEVGPAWTQQTAALQAATLDRFGAGLADGMAQGLPFSQAAERSKSETLAWGAEQLCALAPPGELDWGTAQEEARLGEALDGAIAAARASKLQEAVSSSEKAMLTALSGPTVALLDSPPADLWARLQKLYHRGEENAFARVQSAMQGYDVPAADLAAARSQLTKAAQAKLESHLREAANTALSRMRDRFNESFSRDEHGLARSWSPRTDIVTLASAARVAAAGVLAQLAVVRREGSRVDYLVVDKAVNGMVDGGSSSAAATTNGTTDAAREADDILSMAEWPGVPEADVLLPPSSCRTLWRQLLSDSNLVVQQAHATQEAQRAAGNKMPPLWALFAMVVLGFNEFMALLYNPLYLLFFAFVFFFGKTVYEELEVDAEMQRGLLPGLLALSAKLVPTVQRVAEQTIESLKTFANNAASGELAHGHAAGAHKKDDDRGERSGVPSNSAAAEMEMMPSGPAADGLRKRTTVAADGVAYAS